jgi:uncharacterized protein (DUF362 family)
MSSKVSLGYCSSYELGPLKDAVRKTLEPLGGLTAFISRGDNVLVKPNMITGAPREKPAQTDPAVVEVILSDLLDLGAKPVVGDGVAWGSVKANAKANGLDLVCRKLDVPLVEFNRPVTVNNTEGKVFRSLTLDRTVLEADRVINLPKLKSHKQMLLTCAVKNMFGCMPGKRKAWWHVKAGNYENYFALMIMEMFSLVNPVFTLVDGVIAMEGPGPIKGTPRQMNLLMASTDGPAMERVCCSIMGLKPSRVRIMRAAIELNAGTPHLRDIEIVGEPLERFAVSDFQWPKLTPIGFSFPRFVKSVLKQTWLVSTGKNVSE